MALCRWGLVSKKTGSEEGGHRVADILIHEQRTTQALCVHTQCVRSPVRVEEGLKWRYYRQHGGAHPNLKRELCHGPVVRTFLPQETHNPHHVTLSANCSLLFCISPSSCFCPLSACFGAKALPLCCSVYISTLKGSLVNKHLLMEMPQITDLSLCKPLGSVLVHRCHSDHFRQDREWPLRNSVCKLHNSYDIDS